VPKAAIKTSTVGVIGACVICIVRGFLPSWLARFSIPAGLIWYGVVALLGHRRLFGARGSDMVLHADRHSTGG